MKGTKIYIILSGIVEVWQKITVFKTVKEGGIEK